MVSSQLAIPVDPSDTHSLTPTASAVNLIKAHLKTQKCQNWVVLANCQMKVWEITRMKLNLKDKNFIQRWSTFDSLAATLHTRWALNMDYYNSSADDPYSRTMLSPELCRMACLGKAQSHHPVPCGVWLMAGENTSPQRMTKWQKRFKFKNITWAPQGSAFFSWSFCLWKLKCTNLIDSMLPQVAWEIRGVRDVRMPGIRLGKSKPI